MAINVNEQTGFFHLQTANNSYIFHILNNGELEQVYYGKKIHDKSAFKRLTTHEYKNSTPSWEMNEDVLQPEALKLEYSGFGKGDFRYTAYQIESNNGSRINEFQFKKATVSKGKKRFSNMPASFSDDDGNDVQTLTVVMLDKLLNLEMQLAFTVFANQDVIVRSTKFINHGNHSVELNRALSMQLDLPDDDYDFIHFSGSWARERHLYRSHLRPGIQSINSLRIASGHQHNPFFMLARPKADEDQGEAFGFNLIYSGNFLDSVEVDQYNTSRILVGINPDEFGWRLNPDESFQTPEAVLTYSDQGMNLLSQNLSEFYSKHLVNPRFANKTRPILVNNWEGTYFNFDDQKLLNIARAAKSLGIELFVLDDGWFGHRNDDHSSLGDWFVNQPKFPGGFKNMIQKIHQMGLKFGLWFEPEMISKDSKLFVQHPDWMIKTPGRKSTPSRFQFVLDMTKNEVIDYLFKTISKIVQENGIDYIKWDMNRNITEAYSNNLPADRQLELAHRYILGVYDLYNRLTTKFPDLLFESCASGGGRFDLGMMYYAPQAWTSDDTDAIERLKIQYGTSYGYSLSMMGAHVSAVPNDQTGRVTPLSTRGNVAFYGNLGYELDITKFSEKEKQEVADQIKFYKKYRQLFQFGKFYRIKGPFEGDGNIVSWAVVNQDKSLAIAARYKLLNQPNWGYERIYFKGLDPNKKYHVNDSSEIFYGDELMNAGYFIPQMIHKNENVELLADYSSRLFIIKEAK